MSRNDVVTGRLDYDQNVILLRHGDRKDYADPTWVKTAARPFDPPLIDEGRARAYRTGLELRNSLGFPIHRVFVSPFIRCVETASEAIAALSSAVDGGAGSHVDSSNIKVSIEYGLCEALNESAIKPESAPKDGKFDFNISDLEAMLPAGTIDTSAEMILPEMPRWGEPILASRNRYVEVIQAFANKYPSENLLLVTHGECVKTCVSRFSTSLKDDDVRHVNYCAYSHVKRPVNFGESGSYTYGSFQLLTVPHTTGIDFLAHSSLAG